MATSTPSWLTTAKVYIPELLVSSRGRVCRRYANLLATLGYRVGHVRVIFTLPSRAKPLFATAARPPPRYLAYIEWFEKIPALPDPDLGLFKIKRAMNADGHKLASIVPLRRIRRSVYLFPAFGPEAPREWTSGNVLDECTNFYIDSFSDRHAFHTIH